MTTAEIFVLFYSQEGIKNTLTFVVKVLIILLVSKFINHNPYFFIKVIYYAKKQLKYVFLVSFFLYKNKQKQYTDLEKYGILLYNENEYVKRRKI